MSAVSYVDFVVYFFHLCHSPLSAQGGLFAKFFSQLKFQQYLFLITSFLSSLLQATLFSVFPATPSCATARLCERSKTTYNVDSSPCKPLGTSLVAQEIKHLPPMQETWVQSLGLEDLLEKEMATHSGILAWKIP